MDSIPCPLAAVAIRFGDKIALNSPSRSLDYRQYDLCVRRTAGILRQYGINRGDRVAILLDSSIDYPILLWALVRLGAIACPLSTRQPEQSILSALSSVHCQAIITDRDFAIHTSDRSMACLHPRAMTGSEEDIREYPLTELISNRPATILFTSGSAGEPKAVVHSFANHYYSALGSNRNIDFCQGDIWLLSLPLYHVGGLGILFRAVLTGGTVSIPEIGDTMEQMLSASHATHISVVPTQLFRLLESQSIAQSSTDNLKAVLVGGGPLPQSLLDPALSRRLPIYCSYGLTETASQVTTTSPNASRAELGTAGHPLEHREVRISNDNEILVRGATLCIGYLHNEEILTVLDTDGWFHTGDLGHLDENGNLVVTGRRDNMFISGGENIYPEEIEAALLAFADVRQAIVVPISDREFGFRPIAFVQMTDNSQFDPTILEACLRPLLPGFKIPAQFLPWQTEFENAGLKPRRRELSCRAEDLTNETR